MKTIINFFKFLLFSLVFAFAVILGSFIYKLDVEKQNLKRDDDTLHRICRSNLEGKIAGQPCSMCKLKWNEIKKPKSIQYAITRYAEKKFGKKVKDFTNEETINLLNMLPE
jgi:hypothetical protein